MGNVTSVKSKFFGDVDALDADGLSVAASIGSATTLTLGGALSSIANVFPNVAVPDVVLAIQSP
jgi:hypothetical protein